MNTNQISAKPAVDPCEWGRSIRERVSLESLAELVNATLEVDIRRRFTCPLLYIKMFRPEIRPL